MTDNVSYGRRLTDLAGELGDSTAIVLAAEDGSELAWSWNHLEARSNQLARLFGKRGVDGDRDVVVIALGNTLEHVAATFGAWKQGAAVLPLRRNLPAWERDRLLELVRPTLVVADWPDVADSVSSGDLAATTGLDPAPPAVDRVPHLSRMVASSGSTGTPKIIIGPSAGVFRASEEPSGRAGTEASRVAMCASPLYHTNGQTSCMPPLLHGGQVVLMERFDAARAATLIERHRVTYTVLVPTMLQRIARLDDIQTRDFSSLEEVIYGGASLPEWAARTWLELIPPERLTFMYGGSERLGLVMCNGKEWLDHPGTVGRPTDCEVAILGPDHERLPVGEVGEIWMRLLDTDEEPFEYIGVPTPEPIMGGFRTFGDLGRLDAEGYLYIADRRQDMIVTGGVNVFPAEVEMALSAHPEVADVVVVGLPDPEWGHRVHAIVQPTDAARPLDEGDLRAHCKELLAGPKVPKTFEFLAALPRTDAGKVNRSRLAEERRAGA
ncbi:MAG TPA: AMP-binding protein [Amycolatopsis sp.]|nr:AMP-binding protein [Amycolatopsis sp.]